MAKSHEKGGSDQTAPKITNNVLVCHTKNLKSIHLLGGGEIIMKKFRQVDKVIPIYH